jgi:hypothetical protein
MKKILTRVHLIFVLFSIAFLGYKEFVQGGNDREKQNIEIIGQPVNRESTESKTSREIASQQESKAYPVQVAVQPAKSMVIAYYFHGTFRCATCRTIEQYSHDAIQQYFSKELGNGALEFRPIDVEESENRHYIQDYQLFSKALVLSLVTDGKEMKSKNLTDVWKHVRDKEKFFQYVKNEVEGFLRETQ